MTPDIEAAIAEGRPYFGDDMHANQGNRRHLYFPALARLASARAILEFGSWAGGSICAWDAAAEHRAQLFACDRWAPYLPGDDAGSALTMSEAARSGDIERLFWHNVRAAGAADRLSVLRGDSIQVLPRLAPGAFDLVFLDGDHRLAWAAADIANARSLVRDGGILCGDDLDQQLAEVDGPEHKRAVGEAVNFAIAPNGIGYHPGVTQAVADAFGEASAFDGLWAMQRQGDGWGKVTL